MARMGLTKGERTTLKNCWGTATLFFPIVFDSLSMIGPQITMTALSAIAQSRIFSSKFFQPLLFNCGCCGHILLK